MKTIFRISLIVSALALPLCSCSDFLEKEPLSQGTEAIVFKTPEHFEQAANALYNMNGWRNLNGKGFEGSAVDQNTDINGLTSNGGGTVQESDWHWDKPYSHIRTCNILLAKANEYDGNQEDIAQSVGTAYFFRAWQHFYLLQYFGGIPIVDHVLDVSDPVLFGVRNSRYEVIDFIASDLRLAIPLLPKEKDIPESDKGKVSKEAAKAFLARVLLYEGTWEKYVPSYSFAFANNILQVRI
jgi:starch-binding outer membrane protein, SusD/RagB family